MVSRPAVAAGLAAGWLLASLLETGWGAAAVAATALVFVAWPAVARRRRALPLAVVLVGIGIAVALLLAALLAAPDGALWIQILGMTLLIPLVPIAYAATFDRGDDRA